MNKLLQARGLSKVYHDGDGEIIALPATDLDLALGETLAVVGASGAGKSTLLHLLGGLDSPTHGQVQFKGQPLTTMTDAERTRLRNQSFGFVYQFHHLLAEFSALDNVAMPLWIRRMDAMLAKDRAEDMLMKVGLGQRISHTPAMLSGGERQRVAIARALVTQPECVLADEPTGNLDRGTATMVFDLLIERVRESKAGLIVVTHDPELAARCDRTLSL
jgi:lipoprotein-releasing system ATP-binding protein